MAKCQFCDKGVTFGIKVSHSHRRSNRTWKPNVKRVKAIVDGTPRHVYVCTRCLRSGKVTRDVEPMVQTKSPCLTGMGILLSPEMLALPGAPFRRAAAPRPGGDHRRPVRTDTAKAGRF